MDQGYPALAGDGSGGAIIAWRDWRSDVSDIYAHRIANAPPTANAPADITTTTTGTETIGWTLTDDQGPGRYRVLVTNSSVTNQEWVGLTAWVNGVAFNVSIDRNAAGTASYTIEYTDDQGVAGMSDTGIVIVTVPGGIPGFPVGLLLGVAGLAMFYLTR